MRYAIVGSGAVGGLYGGMLAHAGHDVHFLLHSDLPHVAKCGLRIDSVRGDFVITNPNIYANAADMPRCDVVIVALKSTNNSLLPNILPGLLNQTGVVLSLQNGLDVEADSAASVPDHGVLGGCCFLCSNKVGPGHIRHLDYGRIVFGIYQPTQVRPEMAEHANAIGQQIRTDMIDSGIDAQWTDDLAEARWRKLMWNIPFNGLSVALDASTDQIMGSPPARELADKIIREVHRGAAMCGVKVDESAIEKTMNHTETMVPYDSSMRLDFLNGRPMEIKAIFANPLRAVDAAMQSAQPERLTLGGKISGKSADVMPSVAMLHQQLQFLDSRRLAASNLTR